MHVNTTDNTLVDARAVARRFGVTRGTVRKWVRERRIPCIRASRRVVRFRIDEVEAAVAQPARENGS